MTHHDYDQVQEATRAVRARWSGVGRVGLVLGTGLGALVRARMTCQRHEGWLRLARVGDRIGAIFMVTKLVLVFDTFETIDEAVAAPEKKE